MSLKTWLFGDPEAAQALANAIAAMPAHKRAEYEGGFVGPNIDKLREDITQAHKRANDLVAKLETEIRRLGQEYENAVFAAKGWALLVEHHAAKGLEADLDKIDLSDPGTPIDVSAVELDEKEIAALKQAGFEPQGEYDPLKAGQEEAARLARERLAKLPKVKAPK